MIIESTTKKRLADEYEALSLSLFLDSKKKEIYKLCKIYDSPDLKVKYDNFIKLMKYLHETTHFNELVKPKKIIKVPELDFITRTKQQRFGYTMDSLIDTHTTLEDAKDTLTLDQKRTILLEIGEVITKIKEHQIVYGDLHDANVMIDQNLNFKFIDADCVIVKGINSQDITMEIEHEKKKLVTLVLETLYAGDYSFNLTHKLSEKLADIQMTPRLRGYISSLEAGEIPDEYITDFYDDFDNDVIEYNLRLTNKRNFY